MCQPCPTLGLVPLDSAQCISPSGNGGGNNGPRIHTVPKAVPVDATPWDGICDVFAAGGKKGVEVEGHGGRSSDETPIPQGSGPPIGLTSPCLGQGIGIIRVDGSAEQGRGSMLATPAAEADGSWPSSGRGGGGAEGD